MLEGQVPDHRYMRLFSEVVRHAWKQKQSMVEAILRGSKAEIEALRGRKNKLVDLLVDSRIDQQTYNEQIRRLTVEIEGAEEISRAVSLEHLDVEAVLAFAEKVVKQHQRLWMESSVEQKQKLQKVFFRDGLTVTNTGFGTASSNALFGMLGHVPTGEATLASPTGFEPVLPP